MTLEDLLRKAGLVQYLPLFVGNDIDLSLARELSDTDLKDIGVTSLGHRRKLLKSFTEEGHGAALIERRDVVILFVDLVDFTKLIRSSDPEDAYALIESFLNLVDAEVRACGGTVERHLGDAVMAIFGAPLARGDEAIRAVEFASRIHGLVATLGERHAKDMKIRVGVAYGTVIARSASKQDISVVGSSVNLAARLADVAKPGETLLSCDVMAACGTRISVGPAQTNTFKGFDGPVESRLLLDVSAKRDSGFVGRQAEQTAFDRALTTTKDQQRGQLIVLCGEAGIGKTSLLNRWLSQATSGGLHCHITQIQNFGITQARAARARLIEDLLARTPLDADQAIWLSETSPASRETAQGDVIEAASPEQRIRNRTRAFDALIQASTVKQPLLIAFEDAHWADEDMLDLLAQCSALAARLPVIIVATTRIEGNRLDDRWMSRIAPTPVSFQTIGTLEPQECEAFATALIGAGLDAADVIARSGGHPLYLEQLLRHGQENTDLSVPHSIHTIIQARIDLLDLGDRRAARVAAILGLAVDLEAMRSILKMPDYEPSSLIERRILKHTPSGLSFHHALIRDCIYDTVLRAERADFHRAAANWYGGHNPALRADHLAQIAAPDTATAYLDAAEMAAASWQYTDAINLARTGRTHTKNEDFTAKLLVCEATALFNQNHPSQAIEAYKAAQALDCDIDLQLAAMIGEITALRLVDRVDEAFACIERAEAMANDRAHLRELSHLKYLRGALLFPTGDFQASLLAQEDAAALAQQAGDPERIANALSGRGDALYAQGRMGSAAVVFDECLELCDTHGLVRIKAQNLFMRGTVRIYSLDWAGALEDALASAQLAKTIGNARAEVVSRLTAAWVYAWSDDQPKAIHEAQTGLAVAAEAGAIRFKPFLSEALGHAFYRAGERTAAIECLSQAEKDMRAVEAERFIGPWVLGSLALALGQGTRQRQLLDEAEDILRSGAIGHNHFQFRRLAIDAAIEAQDKAAALDQADRLDAFTRSDPTRWSAREIDRARAFAES